MFRSLLLLSMSLAPGGREDPPTLTPAPEDLAGVEVDPRLAAAQLQFGLRVLREVGPMPGNVLCSPYSLSMALGLALNGARGATEEEMRAALGLEALGREEINAAFRQGLTLLEHGDEEVAVRSASSLWAGAGTPFRGDYLARCRQAFLAEVRAVNLHGAAGIDAINEWAREKTGGMIPEVLDTLPPQVVMVLLNAVWFRGEWQYPFDADATALAPFHRADGTTTEVPRMRLAETLEYVSGPEAEVVRLPYGKAGRFAMYVVLPAPSTDLDALVAGLTEEQWEGWLRGLRSRRGRVELPKFRSRAALDLNDVLVALGMGRAFDQNRADFSGLAEVAGNLYLDQVQQKVYLDVDEVGTEAAAVTSVRVGLTSVPADPFHMVVDRPFLVLLREETAGLLLFAGLIRDPAAQ